MLLCSSVPKTLTCCRLYLASSLPLTLMKSFPVSVWTPPGGQVRATATYKGYEKNKFMQKLLYKKGAKTKKHWYKPHLGEALEVETKKSKRTVSHSHNIRLRQLSHVLYDKIIDIINTGELSQELLDRQVSITAVKMAKDVNSVNVYWEADRKDWKEVEELLATHSGKLRSLLISYHVLGRIPHLVFVKDKSVSNIQELAGLFEKADYGPDYTPGVKDADEDADNEIDDTEDSRNSLENLRLENDNFESQRQFNHSKPRKAWDLDNLSNRFNHLPRSNEVNAEAKSKIGEISFHGSVQKMPDCDIGLSSDIRNSGGRNESPDEELNSNLNFRNDLYGLDRAGIMRKILAKKSKTSTRNNDDRIANEFVDLKQSILPTMDLGIDPKDMPTLVSPFLTKIKLQKKLMRNEKKLQQKMLERDSVDP